MSEGREKALFDVVQVLLLPEWGVHVHMCMHTCVCVYVCGVPALLLAGPTSCAVIPQAW